MLNDTLTLNLQTRNQEKINNENFGNLIAQVFAINMKNKCTKFQNCQLNIIKALTLWKMFDNHRDTEVTYMISFAHKANKNTLETCKNPRPTSGWNEPTKSRTSTMNFHMAYFSWIPQNNARLKLSCKFGKSKCNPYWHITLTTSHGMNYVLNEHLYFRQHDPYAIPSVMIS